MTAPSRDPGLALERTVLAWRRTALAFAVGALVAPRVLTAAMGTWAVTVGLVGVAAATVLWVAAIRWHSRPQLRTASAAQGPPARRDGRLVVGPAAVTAVGALLGLIDVALRVVR